MSDFKLYMYEYIYFDIHIYAHFVFWYVILGGQISSTPAFYYTFIQVQDPLDSSLLFCPICTLTVICHFSIRPSSINSYGVSIFPSHSDIYNLQFIVPMVQSRGCKFINCCTFYISLCPRQPSQQHDGLHYKIVQVQIRLLSLTFVLLIFNVEMCMKTHLKGIFTGYPYMI